MTGNRGRTWNKEAERGNRGRADFSAIRGERLEDSARGAKLASDRSLMRSCGYVLFAIAVLLMSWEWNLAGAALVNPTIPQESIRIRILAHSDSVQDQWVKREVREALAADINEWAGAYDDIEEARAAIRERIPQMERTVAELLERYGYEYGAAVELGMAEFPVKVFGSETYPAGRYEALRITLGDGKGENWWCVMFPPLCFGKGTVKAQPGEVAAAAPEASGADGSAKKDEPGESDKSDKSGEPDGEDGKPEGEDLQEGPDAAQVEYRFFLADAFRKATNFVKGLFA